MTDTLTLVADTLPKLFEQAKREQPNECCALVVLKKGVIEYVVCKNVHANPNKYFKVSDEDYVSQCDEGRLLLVCHSHVGTAPTPTDADRLFCKVTDVPWLIMSYPSGDHEVVFPEEFTAPLVGREYHPDVFDCYTLVKDYYLRELGIGLMEGVRPEGWLAKGENILANNFESYGFVKLIDKEPVKGDVFLMRVSASANIEDHCAVYVGGEKILHQLTNYPSRLDPYRGMWRTHTTHHLRYKHESC